MRGCCPPAVVPPGWKLAGPEATMRSAGCWSAVAPAPPGADSASSGVIPRRCNRQGKTERPLKLPAYAGLGFWRPDLILGSNSHRLAPEYDGWGQRPGCRMGGRAHAPVRLPPQAVVAGQVLAHPGVTCGVVVDWAGAVSAEGHPGSECRSFVTCTTDGQGREPEGSHLDSSWPPPDLRGPAP